MPPYKVQVVADRTGEWMGNGLLFETLDAARRYARDLYGRWTLVRSWRVVDDAGTVASSG